MKPKYLETHHYRKYRDYSSNKCVHCVYEQEGKFSNEKAILRGKYKGYLYCKKLFDALLVRERSVANYEIYSHLKKYLSWNCETIGEADALRDIMNLFCEEFN